MEKKKNQNFKYEMEWIHNIYRFFFFVKLVVGWSNSHCKLILIVELKFGSNLAIKSSYSHCKLILVAGMKFGLNLAIRSSYNCWQHFLAVGSSQI